MCLPGKCRGGIYIYFLSNVKCILMSMAIFWKLFVIILVLVHFITIRVIYAFAPVGETQRQYVGMRISLGGATVTKVMFAASWNDWQKMLKIKIV